MPDGSDHGFGGAYREIVPNERLAATFDSHDRLAELLASMARR
jgi:uncharacterized protein YndB with AHSA1/START domain